MPSMLARFTMANSKGLYPSSLTGNGKRKRTKVARKVKATKRRRATLSRRAKSSRLVKGSAAAKAYMAKIRRKRRR